MFGHDEFLLDWEQALLAPVDDHHDVDVPDLEAERAASIRYARDYGYDVDPRTGRYLPPKGC